MPHLIQRYRETKADKIKGHSALMSLAETAKRELASKETEEVVSLPATSGSEKDNSKVVSPSTTPENNSSTKRAAAESHIESKTPSVKSSATTTITPSTEDSANRDAKADTDAATGLPIPPVSAPDSAVKSPVISNGRLPFNSPHWHTPNHHSQPGAQRPHQQPYPPAPPPHMGMYPPPPYPPHYTYMHHPGIYYPPPPYYGHQGSPHANHPFHPPVHSSVPPNLSNNSNGGDGIVNEKSKDVKENEADCDHRESKRIKTEHEDSSTKSGASESSAENTSGTAKSRADQSLSISTSHPQTPQQPIMPPHMPPHYYGHFYPQPHGHPNAMPLTQTPNENHGGHRAPSQYFESNKYEQTSEKVERLSSLNRCERLSVSKGNPRSTPKFFKTTAELEMPTFQNLVNFPNVVPRRNKGDKELRCVMCGEHRRSSHTNKDEVSNSDNHHIIPRQNKGLCTSCDVAVWVVKESGIEIKWCKGCKNFKLWKDFGNKPVATKCEKCREKQREKYAKKVGRECGSAKKDKGGKGKSQFEGKKDEDIFRNSFSDKNCSHGLSFLIAATNQVSKEG